MMSSAGMLALVWTLFCLSLVNGQLWGTVRLVGGEENYYGRLQVFLYNRWGTVCRWSFSVPEAEVICTQLGFTDISASDYYTDYSNVDDSTPIHLNYVTCSGTERNVLECSYTESISWCDHTDDIFVSCGCLSSPECRKPATDCPFFRHEIVHVNHSFCPVCRCASCPEKPTCPTNCKSGKTMYYDGQFCRRCKCRPEVLPLVIEETNEISLGMMLAVVVIMFVIPVISLIVVCILKKRQDNVVKAKAAAAKKAKEQEQQAAADWFGGDVTQC